MYVCVHVCYVVNLKDHLVCMLNSFDVAVVMILANGSPGNFKSKAEELIKHIRLVKPNVQMSHLYCGTQNRNV